MQVPLRCITADAVTVPAALAVIGPTPSIKTTAEELSGNKFEKYGVTSQILNGSASVWKRTLVVRYDSDEKVRVVAHQETQDAIRIALHDFRPKTVVMTPFSYRHPMTVALSMLFQIWTLYSDERNSLEDDGVEAVREIKIVSKDDVSLFH